MALEHVHTDKTPTCTRRKQSVTCLLTNMVTTRALTCVHSRIWNQCADACSRAFAQHTSPAANTFGTDVSICSFTMTPPSLQGVKREKIKHELHERQTGTMDPLAS